MELTNSDTSQNVKTIDLDNSKLSVCNDTPKKSTKGRKSVLKVNDFRKEAESARFTKNVYDVDLPKTFIQKHELVEKVRIKTIVQQVRHTYTELNHQDVEYNGNKYTVCYVLNNQKPVLFLVDTDSKKTIIENHISVYDGYPRLTSTSQLVHQLIMGKSPSDKYSVDHLNRIRRDDRKCNLKFKNGSEQNHNQFIRDRTVELPEDCGITHNDIPKHVFYINEKDRGERFEIRIKGVPHLPKNLLYKKTTGRLDIPLRVKLQTAIYYLRWICEKYPELKSVIRINKDDEDERLKLTKEYNDIISLTTYPKEVIDANLVQFIYDCKDDYSIDNEEIVEAVVKNIDAGKKKDDNLPADCGITKIDIPKYCYYVPATTSRGDKFVIDKHPKLVLLGQRQMATPETKLLTSREKFDILLEYIDCLENDRPIVKYDAPRGKRGQFSTNIQKTEPITIITENVTTSAKTPSSTNATDVGPSEVPRFVYYKSPDKEHGSYWFLKDHPKLASRNIKTKTSRTSALLSDREKFEEILSHLESLVNDTPFKEYKIVRAVKNSVHREKSTKRVPEDWDIDKYPVSEYLYYRPKDDKRGDMWIIKGHPKQPKPTMFTTTSTSKSTLDKYLDAIAILEAL
jgi:hypothetical protein